MKESKIKILFIDDSLSDVELIKIELKKNNILFISECIENTEKLHDPHFINLWDIVITDFIFPKFSAIDIVRLIRKQNKYIPIIIVSALVGPDAAIHAIKEGANDFIQKSESNRIIMAINREINDAKIKEENELFCDSFIENHQKLLNQLVFTNQLIDTIPNPLFCKNSKGIYTTCNKAFADIFGLKVEEIIGKHNASFASKSLVQKFKKIDDFFEKNKDSTQFEIKITHVNRKSKHYAVYYSKISIDENTNGIVGQMIDISDYKEHEAKLQENEKSKNQLLQNLPGMVYRCKNNKNWTMLFLSKACQSITGYTATDLINDKNISYAKLIEPEYRKYVEDEVFKAVKKHDQFKLVYPIKDKNGERKWIYEQGAAIYNNNKIKYLEGYCTDITLQKNAELEISMREKKYSSLVNSLHEGMAILDNNENIIFANRSFDKLLGNTAGSTQGQNILDFVSEKSKKIVLSQSNIRKKGQSSSYELTIKRTNGDNRILRVSADPYLDDSGNIIGSLGLAIDITNQKKTQEDLKKRFVYEKLINKISNLFINSDNFYDKIQETLSQVGKIAKARSVQIIIMNNFKLKLIGNWRSPNAPKQKSDYRQFSVKDFAWLLSQIKENDTYLIETEKMPDKARHEREIFEKNGIKNYFVYSFTSGNELKGIIGLSDVLQYKQWSTNDLILLRSVAEVLENVIQRKIAEDKIQKLNTEINEKNKELEHVVYSTSHDLRTPLVNVLGFGGELKNTLDKLAEEINEKSDHYKNSKQISDIINIEIPEIFKYIQSGITKIDSMLSALLKFSRTGKTEYKLVPVNMDDLIFSVIQNYKKQAKDKNIDFELSELKNCISDASLLHQVFSNLVDNAIKYSTTEKPQKIKIYCSESESEYLYHVEDKGIGIHNNDIEKIFQIFYRSNTNNMDGEGMGLAITKRILDKLGANIQVESEKGKGSTFTVGIKKIPV